MRCIRRGQTIWSDYGHFRSGEHSPENNNKCKGGSMRIKKTITAIGASLGLIVGLAGGIAGATSGSIDTTGPDSWNEIRVENENEVRIENDNDVHVSNMNHQDARTGEAEVEDNTNGGDAESGSASNENSFSAHISVDNGSGMGDMMGEMGDWDGSIDTTGPDSHNKISFENENEVRIENDNNVHIQTSNCQTAHSGDAEVSHNTNAGSAVSGDASNTSSTSLTVSVSN